MILGRAAGRQRRRRLVQRGGPRRRSERLAAGVHQPDAIDREKDEVVGGREVRVGVRNRGLEQCRVGVRGERDDLLLDVGDQVFGLSCEGGGDVLRDREALIEHELGALIDGAQTEVEERPGYSQQADGDVRHDPALQTPASKVPASRHAHQPVRHHPTVSERSGERA